MKATSKNYIPDKANKVGQLFFNSGTFFLSTALPISGILFIFSIIISFFQTKSSLLKDKWNLCILFIGGLFIFNSIRLNLINLDALGYVNKTASTLDLFNWVPLFILFISSQYYLKSQSQRYIFSKYLISGTIPILISCILQYRFNIYGPFKTFYGFIVLYNKSLGTKDGVSGLFNNANYTGIWLSLTLPILLLLIFKNKKIDAKKIFLIITLIFLSFTIFLTYSRNAVTGLLSTLLLIFGIKKILIFGFLFFLLCITIGRIDSFLNINNINLIGEFKIENLINKFGQNNIPNIVEFTRVKIWLNTIKLIIQKPIFGFGATTFPIVFYDLTNIEMQHSHNMPLELAYNYGIPLSILLTSFVAILFSKSFINIFQTKNYNDLFLLNKCWLASCFVAILNHINDVTYYDGKISILIWIFLGGLKCIFDETNQLKMEIKGKNSKI